MSTLAAADELNAAQREAVHAPQGNLLVLAGAGSGKTRVIIHRIAWLVQACGVSPYSVLAVTFTNKAAGEMRQRLEKQLQISARSLWVGTFHGLAYKLLRLHWQQCGLPEAFTVIDADDQLKLLRKIFKKLNIDDDRWDVKKAQGFINRCKDEGWRASQCPQPMSAFEDVMQEVYQHYEAECQQSGVVDFAELLLAAYQLLHQHPDLLQHYQSRFKHFLVDEFQDTNAIQYAWLKLMASNAESLTVVGDDDQSIYGWRGAKVENISKFQQEFVGTQVIRLEQNYRSTSTILAAANALIDHNQGRLGKTLWTHGEAGDPIEIYEALNDDDEAFYIVRKLREQFQAGISPTDCAVLYRSNAQSRVLEENLVRAGIPYAIYGGMRFFERAEIRDALAYLKLAANPKDDTAFERIINMPPRGIGARSLQKLQTLRTLDQPLLQVARYVHETGGFSGKAKQGLAQFLTIIDGLTAAIATASVPECVEQVIATSGLLDYYQQQVGEKAQARAENLQELVNATCDFLTDKEIDQDDDGPVMPVTAFLDYTSLDMGVRTDAQTEACVQLMTLHSAKGLEFPVVFIAGLEEGLFPHHFSADSPLAVEEERRLCYVGVTRARLRLFLSYAKIRRLFGREEIRRVSRFVGEIPAQLTRSSSRRLSVSHANLAAAPQPDPFLDMDQTQTHGYQLGQRVQHAKFGEGTVVDFEGQGARARIKVQFDRVGSKWLVLQYANLS